MDSQTNMVLQPIIMVFDVANTKMCKFIGLNYFVT